MMVDRTSLGSSAVEPMLKPMERIASIDVLRALTMVLMIFVNDLWSLRDIPSWLGHVERGVDGMGLADVVFPAFLFIVGLSLPYAIDNRRKKGDSEWQLIKHVIIRTIALLVMGVFLVNGETFNAEASGMSRSLWNPLCCFSFILLWNSYPKSVNKKWIIIGRIFGIIILLILAYLYRGEENGVIGTFSPKWWGILGLIGWAYLAGGLITVFAKQNGYVIGVAWAFFCILSMVGKAGYIPTGSIFSYIPEPILGGTLPGLTMGGVFACFIFRYYRNRQENKTLTGVLLACAVFLIALSMYTRPFWGLAKLGATPAWLFLCSAFTLLAFLCIYWLTDIGHKTHWFAIIKPAGTNTLLCYLTPYFVYFAIRMLGIHLPDEWLTGTAGLIKSFLLSILCVQIAGGLSHLGIRLKL